MGNIRKRSKNTWTIQWDAPRGIDGKRRQCSKAVRGTKREAMRELARIESLISSGGFCDSSKMTLGKYLESFLEGEITTVAEKTLERHREIAQKSINPALGAIRLNKLNAVHIKKYLSDALTKGRQDGKGGLSRQTVLHHYALLHKALQDAVGDKLLPYNPMDAVRRPKPEPKERKTLSESDINRLLDFLEGKRLYGPTFLAYATAMRRGEVLAQTWGHMDLDSSTLYVVQSLQQTKAGLSFKPPKTAAGRRQIALSPLTVKMLRKHKIEQAKRRLLLGSAYQDNDLVFPLEDGSPWPPDSLTTLFGATAKRLGLTGISFHSLRHTHATELLAKYKVHPKVVTERLGHSDVSTTLRLYAHVIPSMQEEAAEMIDEGIHILPWEE